MDLDLDLFCDASLLNLMSEDRHLYSPILVLKFKLIQVVFKWRFFIAGRKATYFNELIKINVSLYSARTH